MKENDFWVESFIVGALGMRCSVVTDLTTGDTVIIDGGSEADRIISWIDNFTGKGPNYSNGPTSNQQLTKYGIVQRKVVALLNTHAHFDHSGEIPILKSNYDVDWYLHEDDNYLQSLAQSSAMRWGFSLPEPAIADHKIADGQNLGLGSLEFQILHTPGHTLGGCCLLVKIEDGPDHLFAGDTLFAGSVGRTDLPDTGGDFDVLSRSIKTKLWPLADDTIVYPGHGPLTTIGKEKRDNPFVGASDAFGKFH